MKRYISLLIAFIFLVGMSHAVLAQTQSGDKKTPENTHKEALDRKPPPFRIGVKWYYGEQEVLDNGIRIRKGVRIFEIEDTITWKGKKAFVVRPGMDGSDYDVDYMWVDEERHKVYFWNYEKEAYELNYDFNNDSFYYIEYVREDTTWVEPRYRVDIVSVDTIEINGRQFRRQIIRSQAIIDANDIIENIGSIQWTGPRMRIGTVYDSPFLHLTKLRCFENVELYKFVDFPCDTVWITSTKEVWGGEAGVYPNPHQGRVYFKEVPKGTRYRLYDVGGRLLEEGVLYRGYLDVPHSGVTILELRRKDGAVLRKKLVGMFSQR